eukprot:TRINITY_DN10856_c0_g1_i1.p1 TRINITY_DN10856_c0_g1~~TRINITY_DN10856_c0_g1_i1.p1  ORF type:complete len:318 (-),score=51.75 TRINITY_DN10856_c0_g1_i1:221-1174(-)
MGGLITFFSSDKRMTIDVFLDFEAAVPGENEKEIHAEVADVLNKAEQILEKLQAYKGCEEFIRAAISKPGPDTEKAAWDAILPAVETLQIFYEFSVEVEKIYPRLLTSLFQANDDLKNNLQGQQSLAKQLADIFDFALRFDDMKMVNPGIQNDFSYYRRTLSRMKINNKAGDIKIKDELANRMSLFFAYPTPMMKVLTDTTVGFLKNDPCPINRNQVVAGFSLMANICLDMVEKNRFTNAKTNMFCLRGMTGSIVLVDHLDALGAFHKKSSINVKGAITKLKNFADVSTEGLLNALRYTTVHLNDPETPQTIKLLLQ